MPDRTTWLTVLSGKIKLENNWNGISSQLPGSVANNPSIAFDAPNMSVTEN